MTNKDNPNYYAIIPANVRYDNQIPAGAKLLYGEVTALSNQKGYCFASNGYFARLYDCTPQAISKWFKLLERAGHVSISYHENEGQTQRRVSIQVDRYQPQLRGVSTQVEGVSTTVEYNNTSIIIQEDNRESAPANFQNQSTEQPTQAPPPNSAAPPSPQQVGAKNAPSIEQMIEYLEDLFLESKWQPRFIQNPPETAEEIHDYYTSNGWKVGRNPMKDWKAACRNWLKNNRSYAPKNRTNVSNTPRQKAPIISEETHRRALAITLAEMGITSSNG